MKGVLLIPNLKISYLDEPELIFGGYKEDKDPRIGLKVHGPFSDEPNPFPSVVNVGIVGTGEMITKTKEFLEDLGNEVKSKRKQPWLYQNYPGFNINTKSHSRFYVFKS